MIFSEKVNLYDVKFVLEGKGKVTLKWKCPFCDKEVIGTQCECKAKVPYMVIHKDFDDRSKQLHPNWRVLDS